jgi:hypothetical protein
MIGIEAPGDWDERFIVADGGIEGMLKPVTDMKCLKSWWIL